MKKRLILLVFSALLLAVSIPHVHAQESETETDSAPQESLPIEIKLLYLKLLGQQPSYDNIIASNPAYSQDYGLSKTAVIEQQRQLLSSIYKKAGKNQPLYFSSKTVLEKVDRDRRYIQVKEIHPDEPIIFPVSATEKYGIFFRNGKDVSIMEPPYNFDNFTDINAQFDNRRYNLPVEIIALPIAADTTGFLTESGETIRVIIADIIDFKIFTYNNQTLLLHKRLKEIPGKENPLNSLMDLKASDQPLKPLPEAKAAKPELRPLR